MQTTKTGKIRGKLPVNQTFSRKLGLVGKQGSPEDGIAELAGV